MMRNFLVLILIAPLFTLAQPPAGYYNSASGLTCASLKTALKNIITTGHVNQGYNALWTQFTISDVKPREVGSGSAMVIWDIYSDNPNGPDPYNFTPATQQDPGTGGNVEGQWYNREHTIPLSWHSGSTGSFSGADYHHIFPTDKRVNAVRDNWIYGKVGTASFTSLNGSKLGTSAVAGISGTVFEPIDEFKGDLARVFFYFVTRYQDDMPAWGNNADAARAFEANTFPSIDIPYLQMMIQWHVMDPVSQKEIDRNNAAFTFQGNRNPFVDNPQYVHSIWNSSCPGLAALPVDLVSFTGSLNSNQVSLRWQVANEINLSGYEVERSVNGTSFQRIATVRASNQSAYNYQDDAEPLRGRRVYYRLKQVDNDGSFRYSAILSLHIPLNTRFTVYPNPARDVIQLQLNNGSNAPATVMVRDLSGKLLLNQQVRLVAGNLQINAASLAPGTYTVQLLADGETFSQRVVILR